MKKIVVLFSILSLITYVNAQDVTLSQEDYQSILQRLERLENQQKVDAQSGATRKVDDSSKQAERGGKKGAPKWIHNHLTVGGYGEATAKYCFYSNNYLRYISPEKYKDRSYGEFDLPHVVIYLGYDFGKGWSMGSEIEFEHGGIEAAVEKEEKEGGAEYETELERGGEVALEQFWLQKKFNDYAVIRAGMQVVPIGGLNAHHEPTEFFGVYRPEGEYTILPSTWRDISLTFMGKTKFGLQYQAMFMPGLDADHFNRKNWIKGGNASPYEFKIANAFAGAFRLDYTGVQGLRLSLSGYCGSSFKNNWDNRSYAEKYKNAKGVVTVGAFDMAYKDHNMILRGNCTYGHLSDAALITNFNTYSLIADQTTVASDAIACGAEFGYDFFSFNQRLFEKNHKFYVFARYDWYDAQFRVNNKPSKKNAYCGRQKISFGFNYYPIKEIGIKAEGAYSILKKGVTTTYNDEPLVAVGIVYAGMFKL